MQSIVQIFQSGNILKFGIGQLLAILALVRTDEAIVQLVLLVGIKACRDHDEVWLEFCHSGQDFVPPGPPPHRNLSTCKAQTSNFTTTLSLPALSHSTLIQE